MKIVTQEMLTKMCSYQYCGYETIYCDCGLELPLKAVRSAAGWYAGRFCANCGPYSRESGYFAKEEEAEIHAAKLINGDSFPIMN